MISKVSHFVIQLGTRIQNYGYLLANPSYSKVRNTKGDRNLYRLLNKSWFLHQDIRTVLDVGSNEGQFIKTALALMPDAFIYGFEPNPQAIQKLETTELNWQKVKILPIAFGSNKTVLPLNISKFSPSSSFLRMNEQHITEFPGTETEQVVGVTVDRLDNIVKSLEAASGPFLLKIDVQGFEMEVLLGATGIFDEISVIVCELNIAPLYENQYNFESIVAFMHQHHFQLIDISEPVRSKKTQELLYLDIAFKKDSNRVP